MALWHTLQLLGLAGTFSYAAARLARASGVAAFNRYALVSLAREHLPAMPKGYRVEAMSAATLAAHSIDASPAIQARRFAEGLTCLGAFNPKGALTGVIWLRARHYEEDEVFVRFVLPEGCCWDTGLWIAPQYRLSRAFAALWAGAAEWMEQHGFSHTLSRISDYNLAAILSHRRMNARTLSHHSFVRIGRWQWSSDTRPRFSHAARGVPPELDLRGAAFR